MPARGRALSVLCAGTASTPGPGGKRWLRLAAGNTLVLLFLLDLVLLVGECYYRFIYDASDAYLMSRTGHAWYDRHYRGSTRSHVPRLAGDLYRRAGRR